MTDAAVSVQSISLYPIKSLDPIQVPAARILSSGALEHDREFALFDDRGELDQRQAGREDSSDSRSVRSGRFARHVSVDNSAQETFHLVENRREIEGWFGDFFGFPVSCEEKQTVGLS